MMEKNFALIVFTKSIERLIDLHGDFCLQNNRQNVKSFMHHSIGNPNFIESGASDCHLQMIFWLAFI